MCRYANLRQMNLCRNEHDLVATSEDDISSDAVKQLFGEEFFDDQRVMAYTNALMDKLYTRDLQIYE